LAGKNRGDTNIEAGSKTRKYFRIYYAEI